MKLSRHFRERGHRRRIRAPGPGVPAEPAAHHDRCAAADPPQRLADMTHVGLVRESHAQTLALPPTVPLMPGFLGG